MITGSTHRGESGPLKHWELSLLFIFVFSILLPTAPQAITTTLVALWFVYHRGWQRLAKLPEAHLSRSCIKIIGLGIAASTLCHLLSMMVETMQYSHSLGTILREHLKLMGKQGIWGILMILSLNYAKTRGFNLQRVALPLLSCLFILLIYMVFQRYWGIDWVHGFSARIPDHRYSDGVYRVAGFMSHPLSFAYNASLLTLVFIGLMLYGGTDKKYKRIWCLCAIFSFLTLLLSNSRWPLALCFFLAFALFAKKDMGLFKSKRFILMILAFGTLTVFASRDRISEIIVNTDEIHDEIPRLVFWKVHWELFKDQPISGTGYAGKDAATLDQYNKLGYNDMERKYAAHNIFLQTLADSGLIGFAGLSFILGSLVMASWKLLRRAGNPLLLIIAVFTILGGLMQNNLRDSEYLFALWLVIGIVSIMNWDEQFAARSKI